MISFEEFEKIEIRAGTILHAEPFPEARKPAYKLWVDFGEAGIRQSSAQITINYALADVIGKQVIGILNLSPRRIANFESQVLVTGFADENGNVVLAQPERTVPNGSRLY